METPTKRPFHKSISSNSFHLRSPSLNSVRLRRIFDLYDANHDSFITVDEISTALKTLGLDTDITDLDSMIKSYIYPGNVGFFTNQISNWREKNNRSNAGLTYDDFVILHKSINDLLFGMEDLQLPGGNVTEQEESDLTEAFKVFDEDGDGFISATELQMVLGKLGFTEAMEMESVKMMISSVDVNHDGQVDFSEFKDMMKALQ